VIDEGYRRGGMVRVMEDKRVGRGIEAKGRVVRERL
jgi:hypothetical protein